METVTTRRSMIGWTIAFAISPLLAVSTGLKAAENQDSLGKQLGPITAKIVSDNQAAEKELNLLARVEVRPNEIIEFYEPAPGRIIISGAGTPQLLARFQAAARTPIQAWRLVAPDAEMPVALREAVERSERRKGVQRSERSEQREGVQRKDTAKRRSSWGEGSSARNFSPASGGFCDTGYYEGGWDSCEDFYNYRVCLTNWRDGVFAYHHDAFNVWTQVCPATGAVAFRVTSTEFDSGLWTVPQDTVRYYSAQDPSCSLPFNDCPYVRADVEQAIGVRFHFQFLVEEE